MPEPMRSGCHVLPHPLLHGLAAEVHGMQARVALGFTPELLVVNVFQSPAEDSDHDWFMLPLSRFQPVNRSSLS
jgi:hypothetical protein